MMGETQKNIKLNLTVRRGVDKTQKSYKDYPTENKKGLSDTQIQLFPF